MPTSDLILNFHGELYTASPTQTPLLSMAGGLTGGKITPNFEFPTSIRYALPAANQNKVVTETASLGLPDNANVRRADEFNTCQIHHYDVDVSYKALSNNNRLELIGTHGTGNVESNVDNEVNWQIARRLEEMATDIEWSFVQGQYAAAPAATDTAQTRGFAGAAGVCQTLNGGTSTLLGAPLSLDNVNAFLLAMYDSGAMFKNMIFYCGGAVKQQLTNIYGFAPQDRNVGGLNIQQVETDFGAIGVVLSRFAPAQTLLAIEMDVVAPVFQEVPGKGTVFYEEVSRIGASVRGQIFGQVGFDHGPAWAHGELRNITI